MRLGQYLDLIERRDDPRYRSSHVGRFVRLGDAYLEGRNSIDSFTVLFGSVSLGYATTIGTSCVIHGDVSIGKYCQIGPHCALYALDHPLQYITTYANKRLLGGEMKQLSVEAPIVVGHDVWMGHGVVVLKGVRIGSGAVIGAGSVVTKDVPAYGVAVGNPARVSRKRCDDELASMLLDLAWWDRSPDEISVLKELFVINLHTERERAMEVIKKLIAERR